LNKLRSAASSFAETGVNPYKVTENQTKYDQIRDDIIAHRFTDPALIWQATGPGGISDPDAQRLAKMIPTRGTAEDFENSKAATVLIALIDTIPRLDKQSKPLMTDELKLFVEETGRRRLRSAIESADPPMNAREQKEAAMQIYLDLKADVLAGRITTDPKALPGAGWSVERQRKGMEELDKIDISKSPPTGLGEIWDDLDDASRRAAVRLLRQGATAQQLKRHYRSKQKK
jgi:hypothetical protein